MLGCSPELERKLDAVALDRWNKLANRVRAGSPDRHDGDEKHSAADILSDLKVGVVSISAGVYH